MTTLSKDSQSGSELGSDEQARLRQKAAEVERQNYWEILGLQGEPSQADVKRAYFELSKQYHPDRFFGKDIGEARAHLTKIFQAIKRAYDTLGDEVAQKKYREKVPPPRPAPSAAELEAHRQRILAERKKKARFGPPLPRATTVDKEKAAEHYALALKHIGVGQTVEAMASVRAALAQDPDHVDAKRLGEQLEKDVALLRASRLAERGEEQAKEGRVDLAAQAFLQAFDLSPQKARYGARAVELLLQAGQVKQAREAGEHVFKTSPQSLEARLAYAQVLASSGEAKQGLALLQELGDFDRQEPRVTKLIGRLAKLSSE